MQSTSLQLFTQQLITKLCYSAIVSIRSLITISIKITARNLHTHNRSTIVVGSRMKYVRGNVSRNTVSNLSSKEGSPRSKVVRRVISLSRVQLQSFARMMDLEWRSSDAAYMSFVSEFHRAVACTLLNSERFIPHRSHFSNKNTWLIKRANERRSKEER